MQRAHSAPSPSTTPSAASSSQRVLWVDIAKAISIIGVCALHAIISAPGGRDSAWSTYYQVLDPIRMPLFFMVSGLFAQRIVSGSLADLFFRRIWFLLVPYLAFKTINSIARQIAHPGEQSLAEFFRSVIVGDPGQWFLYALMVFALIAWVMRSVPAILTVVLSFVPGFIYAVAGLNEYEKFNEINHIVYYLPAFMIGLHGRRLWLGLGGLVDPDRAGERSPYSAPVVVVAALLAYLSWWGIDALVDGIHGYALGRMIGVLLAVPIAIVAAVYLAKVPVVSTALAAIGRHTLPIYVSHPILIWMAGPALSEAIYTHSAVSMSQTDVYVVVNLVLCVIAGLIMYAIGKIPVVGWILYPPALRSKPSSPNGKPRQTNPDKCSL